MSNLQTAMTIATLLEHELENRPKRGRPYVKGYTIRPVGSRFHVQVGTGKASPAHGGSFKTREQAERVGATIAVMLRALESEEAVAAIMEVE